jgi:integrase
VPDAVLPKCKESEDTYAYSLEDELTVIRILPETASTVVALAAWTGMRKGELRGTAWKSYTGDIIYVAKSVWRNDVKATKTRASKAPVPVISHLAAKLDEYRELCGSPETGWMFRTLLETRSTWTVLSAMSFARPWKSPESSGMAGMRSAGDWRRICTGWEYRIR